MTFRSARRLVGVALVALPAAQLHGQGNCSSDPAWSRIRVVQPIPRDRSRSQMEQALLAEARMAIVEREMGISVAGTTVRSQSETMRGGRSDSYTDVFMQQYRQEAGGKIIEERSTFSAVRGDSLAVDLEARVACETGSASAGFRGAVTPNQPAYRQGDRIRISLEATEQSRVYLFAVGANGKAQLFFPNRLDTMNLLQPDRVREVPSAGRYSLTAQLDTSMGSPQVEYMFAVFYRGSGSQPFRVADAFTKVFTFAELNAIILRIPRAERAEAMAGYEIRAREAATP